MSSGSDSSDGPRGTPPPGRPLHEATGLDEAQRAERLSFFELGAEDAAALKACRPIAEATVDRIVSDFYAHLLRFPELERLLHAEPDRITKLQGLQRAYFLSLSE